LGKIINKQDSGVDLRRLTTQKLAVVSKKIRS